MEVLQHQVTDLQGLAGVDDALETLSARVDRLEEVTAVQGMVPVGLNDSVATLRGRVQRLEDTDGNANILYDDSTHAAVGGGTALDDANSNHPEDGFVVSGV